MTRSLLPALLALSLLATSGCSTYYIERGLNKLDHDNGFGQYREANGEPTEDYVDKIENARTRFERAIQSHQRDKRARLNLGLSFVKEGEYEKAMEQYNEAIEIDDEYSRAYNNRGALYEREGNIDLALQEYDTAIRHDEKFAPGHYNAGRVRFYEQNKPEAGLRHLDIAIENEKKNALYYYVRGDIHAAMGSTELAKADYAKAVALEEDFTEAADKLAAL